MSLITFFKKKFLLFCFVLWFIYNFQKEILARKKKNFLVDFTEVAQFSLSYK